MSRFFLWLVLVIELVFLTSASSAISLKEAYEASGSANGYDKYIVLESGRTYTGGLLIGRIYSPVLNRFILEETGFNVKIIGNGAILDLNGEQICMSYCNNRLDIEDCVIINGNVRFRGDNNEGLPLHPTGSVRYVTFYEPHDYGVRLQGVGAGILIERNIIVNTIDTGLDFISSTGLIGPLLPSGTAVAASVQVGSYGFPEMRDNWTFFSTTVENNAPLRHFSFL